MRVVAKSQALGQAPSACFLRTIRSYFAFQSSTLSHQNVFRNGSSRAEAVGPERVARPII
jgi:hypothetical protein